MDYKVLKKILMARIGDYAQAIDNSKYRDIVNNMSEEEIKLELKRVRIEIDNKLQD